MSNNFINITQIKHNEINTGKPVYQVQPKKNSIIIMYVGNMSKIYDINISTFDTPNNFKCHMVNKIYDTESLNQQLFATESQIQLITILICINENNYPSAYLSFNFHPTKLEKEYLSTKDNIIHINGNYSISLHFNNKKVIILDIINDFIDIDTIITNLCEVLIDEEVIDLINTNTK
jgi:hypothetical protein